MTTTTANPVALYMASLSAGSQGMRKCLDIIAGILGHADDAETFPWETVTYRESMSVRVALTQRYKPSTVNKMLSTLRGVLKQTWRLGLVDADHYRPKRPSRRNSERIDDLDFRARLSRNPVMI